MGLLGIQERVTHLGGTFAVDSAPGRGTALRVTLPLEMPA
jgi:signal transduction histidine kinase